VEQAKAAGARELRGCYVPTKKNGMVADHYEKLGFGQVSSDPETGATVWTLDLVGYAPRTSHIRILEPVV
jgi:predicted enzyme involved in methoxymalonyl-ACP biosynthesis